MTYLILQMAACLLIAFLLGVLIGWLLCKLCTGKCKKQHCDSHGDLNQETQNKIESSSAGVSSAAAASSAVAADTHGFISDDNDDTVIHLDTTIDLDGDGYGIQTLEGIGPKTADLFQGYGIKTVGDYLRKLHNPAAREQAAKDLDILVEPLHNWACMSDLLRIEGIDHQWAELAVAADVKTTFDLSHCDAHALAQKMESVNNAGAQLIAPTTPSAEQVQNWVERAKNIATVVTV